MPKLEPKAKYAVIEHEGVLYHVLYQHRIAVGWDFMIIPDNTDLEAASVDFYDLLNVCWMGQGAYENDLRPQLMALMKDG